MHGHVGPSKPPAGELPAQTADPSETTASRERWVRDCAAVAVEASDLAIWERDLVTGEGRWDDRMYRLRGLQPDDPRPIRELRLGTVHPDDRERAEIAAFGAVESGATLALQFRVIWPDGEIRWLLSRASRVRDADGAITRLVGTQCDITAAKQAELASEAKSNYVVRLNHEMRTPLNAVLGFAHLLADDPDHPLLPAQQRSLQHIITAGEQLQALLDRGSDLSLIESGAAASALAAPAADTMPPATALPALRLMCIDDDPVSHMLLEKLASVRREFDFHGASTGAAGVALALRLVPQIILVDLHLPDTDGFMLLQRLRAAPVLADALVIAISASSMPGDIEAAERAGFAGYWVKPINVPRLTSALQRVAARNGSLAFSAISAMHRAAYGA